MITTKAMNNKLALLFQKKNKLASWNFITKILSVKSIPKQ